MKRELPARSERFSLNPPLLCSNVLDGGFADAFLHRPFPRRDPTVLLEPFSSTFTSVIMEQESFPLAEESAVISAPNRAVNV